MKKFILSISLTISILAGFAQNSVTITPQGAGAITYGNTNQVGDKIIFADGGGNIKTKIGISLQTFYFHSASTGNDITFDVSGGAELMRIRGNGNVGIGTNNPLTKLHVYGETRLEGPLVSSPSINSLSLGGYGKVSVDAPGTTGGRFTILENGNVGIGLNNPTYPFETKGRIKIRDSGAGESAGIWLNNNGNTALNTFLGIDPSNNFGIFSQALTSNVFTANTSNGNIGIGTSNPAVTLDIKRNTTGAAHLRLTGLNESYMEFYPDNALPTTRWGYLGYSQPDVNHFIINNQRNGNIVFNSNAATRMIISNNGNIVTDASNLNNGTVSSDAIQFGGPSGSGEGIASKRTAGGNQFGMDFYTNSQNRLAIKNNGYIGIGLSSPEHKLTINDPVSAFSAYQVTGVTGNLFNDGLIVGYNAAGAFVYNYENTDLHFATNNNVRMKITANGNLQFEGTSKIVNETFSNVSFQNFWQNNGGGIATAQYYKDKEGRVHLKGTICCGTTSSGTIIFVLPAGYAPLAGELLQFPVLVGNTGAMGAIRIEGNGAVKVLNVSAGSYISLDGISFRAE